MLESECWFTCRCISNFQLLDHMALAVGTGDLTPVTIFTLHALSSELINSDTAGWTMHELWC